MSNVVCAIDGVRLAQSRTGRWIHLGELDKEIDPEHDVQPVERTAYAVRDAQTNRLRLAASDMIRHHGAIHPDGACEFTARLRAALR